MNEWSEEEDMKLKQAIEDHGYSWSRIAACIPPRTDSQCRRRWKVLLPHEVPMLQAARQMKKANTVSNFVDRESECPDITVNDYIKPPLLIESNPEAVEDHKSSKNKRRSTKIRSSSARKVAHTEKVFKLTDEDDVVDNDGHAEITNNGEGPTEFDEDTSMNKKKPTRKERSVFKIRSRRARQVTHTEKVLELMDEGELGGNDDHADITSIEGSRAIDGSKSEVKETATRKRKRRSKEEGDKMDECLETDAVLKKKTMIDELSVSQDDAEPALHVIDELIVSHEDGPISTNKRSMVDPTNERCSSPVKIDSTCEDETRKKGKVSSKRRIGNHDESDILKKSRIKSSNRKRSGYCEVVQEDEYDETLASFLSKVKKRRLQHREDHR